MLNQEKNREKEELDAAVLERIKEDGYETAKNAYVQAFMRVDRLCFWLSIPLGIAVTILCNSLGLHIVGTISMAIAILLVLITVTSMGQREQMHGDLFDERYGAYNENGGKI